MNKAIPFISDLCVCVCVCVCMCVRRIIFVMFVYINECVVLSIKADYFILKVRGKGFPN